MKLPPDELQLLRELKPSISRGEPAKELARRLGLAVSPPAVDRLIAKLRRLHAAGLAQGSSSLHARFFVRGWRRTERGDEVVQNFEQSAEKSIDSLRPPAL